MKPQSALRARRAALKTTMQKLPDERSSVANAERYYFKNAAATLSAHCSDLP